MWTNSELNGIGIELWQDSSYYGEYRSGLKEGIGRYIWKNKARYEGEWKNDMMNGFGIY